MKRTAAPSDRVEFNKSLKLTEHDRGRLVKLRQQTGALEISTRVYVRPAGTEKPYQRLSSATRTVVVHSALNAEQIINGGPVAGLHFTAPEAILEAYEQAHTKEKKTK